MVPEVANLGIVRPPFVYLCAIVLGLLLQFHVASSARTWCRQLATRGHSSAGRRRSVPLCCAHVSDRGYARSGQSSYHHDRAQGALSLESQSHLSVVLAIPARSRILGQ